MPSSKKASHTLRSPATALTRGRTFVVCKLYKKRKDAYENHLNH